MLNLKKIYIRTVANLSLLHQGFKPVFLPFYILMLPFTYSGRRFLDAFFLDVFQRKWDTLYNLETLQEKKNKRFINTYKQKPRIKFIFLVYTDNDPEKLRITLSSLEVLSYPYKKVIQYSEQPNPVYDPAHLYFDNYHSLQKKIEEEKDAWVQLIYSGDRMLETSLALYNSWIVQRTEKIFYTDEILSKEKCIYALKKPSYIHFASNEMGILGKSILLETSLFIVGNEYNSLQNWLLDCLKSIEKINHLPFQTYVNQSPAEPLNFIKNPLIITPELQQPLISVIIPTKNKKTLLQNCIESLLKHSNGFKIEIIIVDNGSTETDFLEYIAKITSSHPAIFSYRYDIVFNYSKLINYGASKTKGDYLLLINNDVEIHNPQALARLMQYAIKKEVGAVGCKLLYSDNRIQHAGIEFDYKKLPYHQYILLPDHFISTITDSDYAIKAITGALMLVSKQKFEEVKGYDEIFEADYNDILFCLSLEKTGYKNIYVAIDNVYHFESVSRGQADNSIKKYKKYLQDKELFLQKTITHL
ncbi:MAG TPA: glycosyltransferase [Cytophagaceae bacterium]|nr:glycosyltransferase [Cytophagaceae bacterium]